MGVFGRNKKDDLPSPTMLPHRVAAEHVIAERWTCAIYRGHNTATLDMSRRALPQVFLIQPHEAAAMAARWLFRVTVNGRTELDLTDFAAEWYAKALNRPSVPAGWVIPLDHLCAEPGSFSQLEIVRRTSIDCDVTLDVVSIRYA